MKGIVSKALSNCGRVLPTAAKASKLQSLSVRPAAKRLAHQRAGQTINTPKPFGVLSNASGLREVNVDLLPREITWLSGAPGAGKGTNSKFISEICGYNAPTIVVSSLLELPEFKRIKDAGGIVDDAAVFKVLSAELAKPQYKNGVVVDGFPRTTSQAEWLAKLYKSSSTKKTPKFNFVMLYVNEETSISRQLARGQHIRAQNSILKTSGGILLEERATDVCNIAAKVRYQGFIEKYEAISKTLAANQFSCYTVDAGASVESVRQSLLNSLTPTVPPILTPTCQPNTTTRFQRQFLASFENIKASSPIEVSTQLSFA